MTTRHEDANGSECSQVNVVVVRPAKKVSMRLAVDSPEDRRTFVVLLMAAGLTAVELVQKGRADAEWVNRTFTAFQRTTTRATGRGGPAA